MKQIEEVEQSLVDYRGMPLLQCGRYIIDGELRIRPSDQSAAKVKYDIMDHCVDFLILSQCDAVLDGHFSLTKSCFCVVK